MPRTIMNNNINVFIVEDNSLESKALVKMLEAHNYTIVAIATSFNDALDKFHKTKEIDIMIIDVFLGSYPEGINFAETINANEEIRKPFLYLTSSIDKTLFERAKTTMPFNYMIKPFNELELLFSIGKAIEYFHEKENSFISRDKETIIAANYLYIQKGGVLKKVLFTEIIYVEVEGRYCNIITEKEKFVILISLTKIRCLLDVRVFKRASRSFIVNTKKIEEIYQNDNLIILSGGYKVNFSDKYKGLIEKNTILK